MKKSQKCIIAILIGALAIAAVGILLWPRRVQLSGIAAGSQGDLTVAIFTNNGFHKVAADPHGEVALGRGPWRAPWQDEPRLFAVSDDNTMYCEGVFSVPFIGTVVIPLGEGYPKTKQSDQSGESDPRSAP